MSIFNVSVSSKISGSLSIRQNLMGNANRTVDELTFLNSNTSWVKLSSSVNINGSSGDAQANVLAGGTLFFGKQKSGVGVNTNNAYSSKNSDGSTNLFGIRPMPGITSVSVDNIGAYGSIRKATVNFQCWDIQQLELLEQLYMRPGYTLLLEFGRDTYLDSAGKLKQVQSQTDFFKQKDIDLQVYLKKLYTDSLNSGGNYDAFFGYITNYSWTVRDDGGYDCKTEILSTGEILESVKVNYSIGGEINFSKLGIDMDPKQFRGFLFPTYNPKMSLTDITRLNEEYSTNVLGGLITELWLLCRYDKWPPNVSGNPSLQQLDLKKYGKVDYMNMFYKSPSQSPAETKLLNGSNDNYFITLESFANLFTKLVLPDSTDGGKKTGDLVGFSTKDRAYIHNNPLDLLCLFNTYMTSTNPDVCMIKSPQWASILSSVNVVFSQSAPVSTNILNDPDVTDAFKTKIANWVRRLVTSSSTHPKGSINSYEKATQQTLVDINNDYIASKLSLQAYLLKFNKNYQSVRAGVSNDTVTRLVKHVTPDPKNPGVLIYTYGPDTETVPSSGRSWLGYRAQFYGNNTSHPDWILERDILRNEFTDDIAFGNLMNDGGTVITGGGTLATLYLKLQDSSLIDANLDSALQAQTDIISNAAAAAASAAAASTTLKEISVEYSKHVSECKLPFKFQPSTKGIAYGNTSNIYVNLKFLYKLATDSTLMSQDSTGKNSLSAMSFLTPMARGIQTALGNVNNFAIHIDPIDGIARMVDINYINREGVPNLFTFEIGSNKSIVRNLNLESQIFSDQSSMVAISAQSDAGKLGLDNSTLVSYNKGITDRMIAKKDAPLTSLRLFNTNNQLNNFISSLAVIANRYLKPLFPPTGQIGVFNASEADSYSNALRDIINFIASVRKSDNKDKGFIPTQISLTLDGIAGWVIGNLFKVDETFIPQYYKRKGGKSGYIVTKIGHQVENNSWTTTIKGYPFNLDNDTSASNDTTDANGNPISFTIVVDYNPNNVLASSGPAINVTIKASKSRQAAYDKAEAEEPGFKAKVRQVAAAIGASEDALMAVMNAESGINSDIINSAGAVGLIQFFPATKLDPTRNTYTTGKNTYKRADLLAMSRIRQLDLVLEYFQYWGLNPNTPVGFPELYGYTFLPGNMKKGKFPGNGDLNAQFGDNSAYNSNQKIGNFIPATNSKGQRIISVGSFIEYTKSVI
jgi:hypothetical protein